MAAIDPGKTSGYIFAEDFLTGVRCGETADVPQLLQLLTAYKPDVVVIEVYRLYPWRAREQFWGELPAAQATGALKVWCGERYVTCIEQAAVDRAIISDGALRAAGLWRMTRGKPHARDAARHLLVFYMRSGFARETAELLHGRRGQRGERDGAPAQTHRESSGASD